MKTILKPIAFLIFCCFLCAEFPAAAQQSASFDPTIFNAFIADPAFQQDVIAAAKKTPAWGKISCPSANFIPSSHLGIFQPPQFDAQHKLISGIWKYPVIASGCGTDFQLNTLVLAKDGNIKEFPLEPGTSITDPLLQRDAIRYAVLAAGKPPVDCKDMYFADTRFMGDNASAVHTSHLPWQEEWTLVECGVRSIVTLHFTPDATGTVINASPKETRH